MAVLPKCPVCLVAYGSLFASTAVSSFITGPLGAILAVATVLLFGLFAIRRRSPVFGLLGALAVVAIYGIGRDQGRTWGIWLGLVLLMIGVVHEVVRCRKGESCQSR